MSISLIGRRFGNVIILDSWIPSQSKHRIAFVLCDCGNKKEVRYNNLVTGTTKSCGCLAIKAKRNNGKKNATHGMSKHPIYAVWAGIKERCDNKKLKPYGMSGIKMCDHWRKDFLNFYKWALDNNWKEGLHVDRFPNNKGNYEPDNCRIVSIKENNRNRTSSIPVEYKGQSKCIAEWAELYNIPYHTLWSRLKKGWSIEKSLKYKRWKS